MPIEVRQMLIKSTVDSTTTPATAGPEESPSLDQLREDILAECKLWFEERLQQMRER